MFTGPQGGLVIIQSTGAVTTGTHGYEEACQLFVYIPQQLHVSYILKRIEVFFLIVVVSNNDNDKKKNQTIYPLSNKIYYRRLRIYEGHIFDTRFGESYCPAKNPKVTHAGRNSGNFSIPPLPPPT